ncbi:MAG: hypothetical protein H0X33_07180 [Taibaiella sp.]|nr:hypothetical protein [Taibaiella sp.]
MKRVILLIAAAAFAIVHCQAQDFKTVLKKTVDDFSATRDQQQQTELSNKLGLIAKKWPNEWAGHYYNAYGKAQLSYMEKDEAKRDAYLDEAETELSEAVKELGKDNDETYVMAAMIANARLAVKPQSRWQKYGPIFKEDLEKARAMNPDNPRIYYLEAQSKFHTPKMFGGGKKAALPYFEKADGLFAKQSETDITKPYWGKPANTYFMGLSKGEDKE